MKLFIHYIRIIWLFFIQLTWCSLESCLKNSTAPECVDLSIPDNDITKSLTSICGNSTTYAGCSIWQKCKQSKVTRPYCSNFSVLSDVCTLDRVNDNMCTTINTLCAKGKDSKMKQCREDSPFPSLVSTTEISNLIIKICTKAPVLSNCTNIPKKINGAYLAIDNLSVYSSLCNDLSTLDECETWNKMCEESQSFGPVCNFDNSQKPPTSRSKAKSQSPSTASVVSPTKSASASSARMNTQFNIIIPLSIFLFLLFINL